jgi:phenylpropionate dioxygenase-like ring-hydroxylating dioxygenase large terminal subunit
MGAPTIANQAERKAGRERPLSKNQQVISRRNELDVQAERRLYKIFRHFWHPVIYSAELTDKPQRVMLCEQALVVARIGGELSVFSDLCAHRGAALSLGEVLPSGELQCPYHGWRYDAEGNCTLAPQRPDLAGHLRARVKKYQSVERYGMVWVCLEDDPYLPMPEFPQFEDPSYDTVFIPNSEWNCSSPRRTENYTDLSHFAFVHDGFLGDRSQPGIPEHRVWREGNVVRMLLDKPMAEPKDVAKNRSMATEDGQLDIIKNYHVFMPLTVLLDSANGDNHYCLFFHPTPVGPKRVRNFTVGARNYGSAETIYDEIVGWNELVYGQDKPIVESQRPEELPEDLSMEMYVQNVDTFSLTYRKYLLELIEQLDPR